MFTFSSVLIHNRKFRLSDLNGRESFHECWYKAQQHKTKQNSGVYFLRCQTSGVSNLRCAISGVAYLADGSELHLQLFQGFLVFFASFLYQLFDDVRAWVMDHCERERAVIGRED